MPYTLEDKLVVAIASSALFDLSESDRISECVMHGHPAGLVLDTEYEDDASDELLRIAFDFDGVLIDDEAERIYQEDGINGFRSSEQEKASLPHTPGPMAQLLRKISEIQKQEIERHEQKRDYEPRIRIAIITSRDAKALERMVTTLRHWNISVDETHLLGGVEKKDVIEAFAPHIFFDDQRIHLDALKQIAPAVHVPFGVGNEAAKVVSEEDQA